MQGTTQFMKWKVIMLSLLVIAEVLCYSRSVKAQQPSFHRDAVERAALWKRIAPFFSPPDSLKDDFGHYRSSLEFYDGRQVVTPVQWKERRGEILSRWMKMMGPWPPLLTDQKMVRLDSVKRESFIQYHVSFFWTPTEKTDGYLLVPEGPGKKAAVITVYYEPETAVGWGKPDLHNRDFAYQLARRGFVTLSIGTRQASLDHTFSLYYPSIGHATVQPLSMLACAAANAWYVLAKVPQVDSTRIGIMGHSFGGKWAMFASCLFDKFACAVWSDPGIVFDESREAVNYWEPWYLGYHPKPWRKRGLITRENPAVGLYPRLVAEGYDLQELHALMAPRPFLVSGGAEDRPTRWIPLNRTLQVDSLLGYRYRVALTSRPAHAPTVESDEQAYEFLSYFLKYKGIDHHVPARKDQSMRKR
jgi:dienelactone hydrolase